MTKIKSMLEEISLETVKRIAHIMGENSAAAKCLKEAPKYPNPVFIKAKDRLLVMSRTTWENDFSLR